MRKKIGLGDLVFLLFIIWTILLILQVPLLSLVGVGASLYSIKVYQQGNKAHQQSNQNKCFQCGEGVDDFSNLCSICEQRQSMDAHFFFDYILKMK